MMVFNAEKHRRNTGKPKLKPSMDAKNRTIL